MPKPPLANDSAVVEVAYGLRVDAHGKRKWLSHDAVLAFRDEIRLPLQALDLPGAEEEGCDGDDGEDDEPWSVSAAGTHKCGGVVEDRGEVGVVGWLARFVCARWGLREETGGRR